MESGKMSPVKAANPNWNFMVSGNWPWLRQRPGLKNNLFHLVTQCLTAWLPFCCSAHMGHMWVQKSLKSLGHLPSVSH